MSAPAKFNIRVYGILVRNGRLLVNEEKIFDRAVIKFPGGGLHLGEGIIDCLKREWKEELSLEIAVLEHFYTTDFFQVSAFDDSQVISIYYKIDVAELPDSIVNNEPNERAYWMALEDITESTFTLPIDKVVGEMLMDNQSLKQV